MSLLELRNASVSFGKGDAATHVLRDVNLSIRDGEFVAIVGYSGTGKTTLINLLAGLVLPDRGEAIFDDKPIVGPGPERGLVFQNYSLLPWLSVADNVRLAIDQVHTKSSSAHRQHLVEKYVGMVNLSHAMNKLPHELSGGMRQRVSVARALAMNPQVLLLDEPLSALDALTRATIQDEIANIWQRDRKTVVLITNDVDEGILLADRIVPLLPGNTGATLGESVAVDIERPRDRKAINHCRDFKCIRKQVFDLLLAAAPSKQTKEAEHVVNAA